MYFPIHHCSNVLFPIITLLISCLQTREDVNQKKLINKNEKLESTFQRQVH